MSLIRQIGLLLFFSLLTTFVASIAVSVNASRESLQTQLNFKNSDNALALALVLSQQQGNMDRAAVLMAAQFDTGFYQEIRFTDPQGAVVFLRTAYQPPVHAPAWFARLVSLHSIPGVGQVMHGWSPMGSVQVISHSSYVLDDLWTGARKAVWALTSVLCLTAVCAWVLVASIRKPLGQAVDQAQALVQGEFKIISVPRIPELARLTQAMNAMVQRLRMVHAAHAAQVESLRLQAHCDALTGLANRKHFFSQLSSVLQREDGAVDGGLVLLRVTDLALVNREIGHDSADRLITTISGALQTYVERVKGCYLGRLNGADFALYLPVRGMALETGTALVHALRALLPAFGPQASLAVGVVEIQPGSSVSQVMGAADAALASAECQGPFSVVLDAQSTHHLSLKGQDAWRQSIASALVTGRVRLVSFPVINAIGQILHLECPLRLKLDPDSCYEVAALWLPLALRSRLTPLVDERAISLALTAIAGDEVPRSVNACAASLSDPQFAPRLRTLLERFPLAAQRLMMEVPESAVVEHFEKILELARLLRSYGARLGLEHAGEQLTQIAHLFESGFQYVKLDASIVCGVAHDAKRKEFVQGVVTMLKGVSTEVFAEGVVEEADAQVLWQLGLDGITGPWASSERPDWVLGTGPG